MGSSWTFHEHFMNIIHESFKGKSWIVHDHLAGAECFRPKIIFQVHNGIYLRDNDIELSVQV